MNGFARRLPSGLVAGAVLALVAACGAGGDSGSGEDSEVAITSPSDGDNVGGTFTVQWDSRVELGEPETGRDHVHVFVDGSADDYAVVGGNELEISGLPPGEHTVNVTLQHADHSSAGSEDEVEVTVSGAGGTSQPTEEPPDGGGYGY